MVVVFKKLDYFYTTLRMIFRHLVECNLFTVEQDIINVCKISMTWNLIYYLCIHIDGGPFLSKNDIMATLIVISNFNIFILKTL